MENHHQIIERYQILYEKNHRSKVFAPLAESYIKMGLLQPALEVCEKGVKLHPHFPSGHMALAKVYLEIKQLNKAISELKKVVDLSPENILAHKLLAETFLAQNELKSALRAFKMVLFLSPKNGYAIENIRKIEKLMSVNRDDTFEMKPLQEITPDMPKDPPKNSNVLPEQKPVKDKPPLFLERTLSLADTYIERNNIKWALKTLEDAENSLGPHPEISKRMRFLSARPDSIPPDFQWDMPSSLPSSTFKKVAFLKKLLARIEKNTYLKNIPSNVKVINRNL